MHIEWINLALAFFEGFGLIISPCILPILPIILSGSLTGKKTRPIGIICGFILTFTIVTLFSKLLIGFLHINENSLRNFSFAILLLLGVVMLSTTLTEKFNILTQKLTGTGSSLRVANDSQGGFFSGLIFGGLVGIIWTPCAGPILAAVIVQAIIQTTTLSSLLIVFSFAIGAGLPMLLIALLGRTMMEKFSFFRQQATLLRKFLGAVIITTVLFLIYDSAITFSFARSTTNQISSTSLINGLSQPYHAPDIAGIDAWVNSAPLQMSQLKGKIVLIDFWTYSCINCLRTLPYLKDWYAKYHDKGFEIIGVHSPEFAFERNLENVKNAVIKLGIRYPVALDNNFVTWQNFHNQYWPAHYLINKQGAVVYQHFGEGEYAVTENNIRYLLGIAGSELVSQIEENYSFRQTPETYLGYARAQTFSSPQAMVKNGTVNYSYPRILSKNTWALRGKWAIYADKIVAMSAGAAIKLHFDARKVYAVMGSLPAGSYVTLRLNGELLADERDTDVSNSQIKVTGNRLYTLLNLKQETAGIIELTVMQPGLEIYTFTFGT